ncbi:MAG: fibronectin type III domain-containing protein, partial [Anaerolineae bacterium]|nr:fibronectin type III domain-containing protein [Anaerolineae bacterium]
MIVTDSDHSGNAREATFHVFRDAVPPDVWVSAPAQVTTNTIIPLTWGGQDSASGLARYDVDLQVDAGVWQRVLMHTQATAHTFTDLPGERYTFRVTAT